jgi:H+-transporting ATPase
VLLAIATWVVRASMYVPNGGIIQNWGNVQEVLFLEVALTENWLIFVTRGGQTFPSWQLIIAIGAVDALATLFCVFGWLAGNPYQVPLNNPMSQFTETLNGHTDIVTVVVIWGYSIGVTIVIAIVYYLLNSIPSLADIGRKSRSHHDSQMENIIGHLTKLTLQYETTPTGEGRYLLQPKAADEDEEE